MKMKRILSLALVLAMLVGIFPGMSLTASATGETPTPTTITPTSTSGTMTITLTIAAPHDHSFTYSASGATITATCTATATDCPLPPSSEGGTDHAATLTLAAPTLTTYNETGKSAAATLTGLDAFKTATGLDVAATNIKYYNVVKVEIYGSTFERLDTENPLNAAPTDAGKYGAGITLENVKTSAGEGKSVRALVSYTIAKATPTDLKANQAKDNITINYTAETATPAQNYEVSTDGQNPATLTEGSLSLTKTLDGNSPKIYVRTAESNNYTAGTWVEVSLASRPAAPSNLTTQNATSGTTTDGRIKGTTADMEYSANGGTSWTGASASETTVGAGTYLVRTKATSNAPHGVAASVTVGSNYTKLTEDTKPEIWQNDKEMNPDTLTRSKDVLKAVTSANPVTYQWQTRASEGEWTDVQGATSVTYTVTDDDCNKQIRVVATQSEDAQGNKLTGADVIVIESVETTRVLSAASIGNKHYSTIEAALTAAQAGDTVKLEYDIENLTVANDKDIVLDLNNRWIEGTITNNGKLTIKDSSGMPGTVRGNVTSSGELTIEEGEYRGEVAKAENGKVTIKGGYFKQEWDAIRDMVDSDSQQDTSYKDDNGTYKTHVVKKPAPPAPSTPSTPAVETITIPVSGEDATVNVTVQVKDNTATVTSADVDKVLEAKDVGTVTVDVSSLKEDVKEVVLPAALVEKVATAVADKTNDADSMEVKLPAGTVTFDEKAVAAIKEQSKGKDLHLNLDAIKENKLNTAQQTTVKEMADAKVLDAYMTADGKRISDFEGGSATVSVPYALKDGQVAKGVVAWYVADDGKKTEVPCTYDGKNANITVAHFSNYVIAYDAEKAAEPEPQPEPEPEPEPEPATPTDISYDSLSKAEKKNADTLAKTFGVDKNTAAQMLKEAKKLGVSMDTLKLTGANLAKMDVDSSDAKGSDFGKLLARATKRAEKTMTLQWKKVKGADGYLIYGNKCGKKNKMKLLKTIKKNGTVKWTQKKLKKGTYYKYMVVAYKNVKTADGKKTIKMPIAASVTVHATTKGAKNTIAKSVKVNRTKVSVKKGKTFKIKASEVKDEKRKTIKQHRKVKFESSNKKIATVSAKGVVKGVKKGTATIYVYSQNGLYKTVKVTVK